MQLVSNTIGACPASLFCSLVNYTMKASQCELAFVRITIDWLTAVNGGSLFCECVSYAALNQERN